MRTAIFLLTFILIFSLPTSAYAEGELKDIYKGLPSDINELMPESFDDELEKDSGTSAIKLFSVPFFVSFFTKSLNLALSDSAPMLLNLTVTVLLSALLSSFSKDGGSVGKAMTFASGAALCFSCISVIKPLYEDCIATVEVISGIIKVSLPIMTSISLSGGQVASSEANSAFLSAVLALTEEIGRQVLTPVIAVSIALATVSTFMRNSGMDLSHVVSSVKKIFVFFISALSTVLCCIMAFQTVIAKGSDTILLRSIKFASGNSIPIVGASLSEAMGTYISGISLIKSSAGTLIAAAIAISALPMILKLFAAKLSLSFVGFISDTLGLNGSIIRDFVSICDMLIAVATTSSVIFVISMGLFASVLPSV